MTFTRRAPVAPIVWSLTAPFMVLTLGMGLQVGTPDPSPPTALEQALIEHMCTAKRAGAPGSDAYEGCTSAQLLSLRADFGRDLGRLSASERKTIDSVCSKVTATRGRDAYLACLSGQLVSLRDRRNRANPSPSEATPVPSPSVSAAPASPPPAGQTHSWSSGVWIGATLATVIVAAGGVFLAVKARRAPRKCRVCGTAVSNPGDLCQKCRHEAAEAMRHAAAERANHLRAQEEEPRRQREREEEQRRQRVRHEEEARVREQEQARQQEEEERQREEAREAEEEARQRRQADVAFEEVFDPYAVLGVPRDASKEDIQAAYQQAKSKYDPDQVGHLSAELQAHFKAKAQAVDRAYQMLTE
jgi:hypothetical protein